MMEEKYPFLSTYNYVANSPLNAIDPDGKDIVYLNKDGKVVRVVNNHSPIIKIVEFGSKKARLYSSYDITSSLFTWNNENRQIIANVTGYYAKQANIKASASIGASDDEKDALAHTTPDRKKIQIVSGLDGKIDPILNNKYNLISVIEHEIAHTKEELETATNPYTFSDHVKVYTVMASSPTFSKASPEHQNGQILNLVRYLQSAKNKGEDYLPLITNFNNTVKNYKIKDRDSGGIQVLNKEGNELIPAILNAPPSDPH